MSGLPALLDLTDDGALTLADGLGWVLALSALGLLILLVTCTNVSALQTGLAMMRRREIAIRLSMGASRRRIIRQLLTETVILATLVGQGLWDFGAEDGPRESARLQHPQAIALSPDAPLLWIADTGN